MGDSRGPKELFYDCKEFVDDVSGPGEDTKVNSKVSL